MPGIFISYRSADAQGFAGRLADDLTERFGEALVFRDDELVAGSTYPDSINAQLHDCEALLAIIGPNWGGATTLRGASRLQDPDDWVRKEIEVGLARDAYVVPVLVAGAELPPASALPKGMRPLAYRQSFELSDDSWRHDVERLASLLVTQIPSLRHAAPHRPGRGTLQDVLERVAHRLPRHGTARRHQSGWQLFFGSIFRSLRTLAGLLLVALFVYFLVSEYSDEQTKEFFRRAQRFALRLISVGKQALQALWSQHGV